MPDGLFDLTGRTALVTGSTRGIGYALARGLLAAGARVVVHGRDAERAATAAADLATTSGAVTLPVAFDVTAAAAVDDGIARVEAEWGTPDILVNNAGVQRRAPLLDFTVADWNELVATNLTSAFLVSQRVGGGMVDRGSGKIVMIGSVQSRLARPGIATNPGGTAQAPAGAPNAVRLVIAAGNAIAGLPYSYGGGHGSFQASAYDCSGSISYALAAAGLVSSPMASGPFMSWGDPGPGRWITVYANAGHAFMVVAGWRFDTSALGAGGTRWTRSMRPTGGFVARHPPGL